MNFNEFDNEYNLVCEYFSCIHEKEVSYGCTKDCKHCDNIHDLYQCHVCYNKENCEYRRIFRSAWRSWYISIGCSVCK